MAEWLTPSRSGAVLVRQLEFRQLRTSANLTAPIDGTLAGVRQVFACYGIAAALGVIVRVVRTADVIVAPTRSELFIGNLGVSPERRGGGIGAALIEQLIAQHRRSGIAKAVLDVAVTNPRAQQLYERLGFNVTAERRSRLANSQGIVVNHRRMEKPM
jgi:ribosomal protein S18 acetylase RimI-like enzyme